MNICLNNMFPEKCYPIRGTITLIHGQDTYTCSCVIKHRWNIQHNDYDDSEIGIYIHNIIEEKLKDLSDKNIYLKADEYPTRFEYIIDAYISHIEHFNRIKICNAIVIFENNLSISFPLQKDEIAYFYPLINMIDDNAHYFDIYAWNDETVVSYL